MKTIKLEIELTYDDDFMHDNEPESIKWFVDDILINELTEDGKPNLILHSNELGDEIGTVKVLKIYEKSYKTKTV